jgi:LysM repeat protein
MATSPSGAVPRCPACGSRLPAGSRTCDVCGATQSWATTPAGLASLAVGGLVLTAVALLGLLWLRGQYQRSAGSPEPTRVASMARRATPARPAPTRTVTGTEAAELTAATAVVAAGAEPTAAPPVQYSVQNGDSPWSIAQSHGVDLGELLRLNPGIDQRLSVGQQVTLPLTPTPGAPVAAAPAEPTAPPAVVLPTAPAEPVLYTARAGDTVEGVAASLGLPAVDLVALNRSVVSEPAEALQPGQVLQVAPLAGGPDSPAPFPAPMVLAPANGATVRDDVPVLRWASAGILPDDAYYVITIGEAAAESGVEPERIWVPGNATTAVTPPRFRPPPGASRTLVWSVAVRRAGADGPVGPGEALSAEPAGRSFVWSP